MVSEGEKSHGASSPTSNPMNKYVVNSFANSRSNSNNCRAGVQIDTFSSNLYRDPSSNDFYTQSLIMPKKLNPHLNGLRQYVRLRKSQEKEELQNRKAQTTYGTAA